MRYFTSDLHFFDAGIIEYAGRPFASAEEMNTALIKNFRERTGSASEIYILGDIFGMMGCPGDPFEQTRSIFKELGIDDRPFHLMCGNHDHLTDDQYREVGFRTVMHGYAHIDACGRRVMITHDPCMIQPRGTAAICGHIHTLFRENWSPLRETFTVNVAVEARGYAPVSEDEIADLIDRSPLGRSGQ